MFKDLYSALAGKWILERSISHFGELRGLATFEPFGQNQYKYSERGKIRNFEGSVEMNAEQHYLYQFTEDCKHLSILFFSTPPSLFQDLTVEEYSQDIIKAKGYHLCARDNYYGSYHFSKNRIEISYFVDGPKKDFVINTVLIKTSASPK